jgi:hypothetical protein
LSVIDDRFSETFLALAIIKKKDDKIIQNHTIEGHACALDHDDVSRNTTKKDDNG